MHLKSLTVRGFKSFASATSFEFEPGVTAVVGPNGSGKSNVVDALAWVMGEQGAKTLRGGKMEDVIFAGTSGRPPLGRAQVSLTIDNSDGALPIEYSEVTISRTLFRAGGSEYAINGEQCRLLDIQELLSDSGLGREMHVIIGQGQLDRVLHATPEDRRGFIEEASGILKHRRRKEKTLRKLDAMQANLQRLQDLTSEIRRQLTPLGKQAAVARRAQTVQFDLRDARSRLLADDLVNLRDGMERDQEDQEAVKLRQQAVTADLERARHDLARLEVDAAQATPAQNAARDMVYSLGSALERFRSLAALADERSRLLGQTDASGSDEGRDPERLAEQADQLTEELEELQEQNEEFAENLEGAVADRGSAEEAAAAEEQRLTTLLRAAADRREGLARLAGQVAAARSRVEAAEGERDRLRSAAGEASERRDRAQEEYTVLEQQAAHADGEPVAEHARAHEAASQAVAAARSAAEELQTASRDVHGIRAGLQARVDTLTAALERRDASADALERWPEVLGGRLSSLMRIEAGYEQAVAAVLGPYAEALTVDAGRAPELLGDVRRDDLGRLHLVHLAPHDDTRAETPVPAAAGADAVRAALSVVEADSAIAPALAELLAGTVVVEDVETAYRLLGDPSGGVRRAVTRDGHVVTGATVEGGTAKAPSLIEQQADLEAARVELDATADREAGIADELAAAREALERAQGDEAEARRAQRTAEARNAEVGQQLAGLSATLRQADAEVVRLNDQAAAAQEQIARELASLEDLAVRLDAAQQEPDDEREPSSDERDRLNAAAAAARQREVDSRLALRSGEERAGNLNGRIQSLRRAAETERRARAEARRRARVRARQAGIARAVAAAARHAAAAVEVSLAAARDELTRTEAERTRLESELADARKIADSLNHELGQLTDRAHREELARAEQRLKIEVLEDRAVDELGLTPEHLVENYGPDQPVPVPADDKWAELRRSVDENGEPVPEGVPYDRAEQTKRLKRAEKDLQSLGKVNPLALEEFAALEERHKFLVSQLEDLTTSRQDLLDIIKGVDEHVEQVFTEAYADTKAQFERVFGRLFPGGEGRLVLTDPDDMLNTGIEVEARPAGKKVKRLSLLSGGERSLTAVALLVAIFKARPSPFYVMDEVEAALDDTNLGRLIMIFEELRESSQLIIITHQKRTMEVADALYGVSMRGDGVSQVISQKLERVEA
ncbi:chromosome segregation protein SMC [Zhihengliuella salsuginis]|uniref:Chromosome partition protein Smc n=1 Tax=Zhihengliuella salsuginis TaxID=578222 RepID=A0ABQ3GM24_9MICC|nr:chromosome segregation protein SMC [Zhihengliuella salsuginis]GHD11823.1 chromosome partition protein Smc [Zhihengliuella salsuginis]